MQPSLGSSKSYEQTSVPSPSPSDRYLGVPTIGHAAEQRLREVYYVALENIDPTTIEQEVHALLLQAIQNAHLVGYQPFSPLSMPALATSPPMQPDVFPNWEQELFISNTLIHLSLE